MARKRSSAGVSLELAELRRKSAALNYDTKLQCRLGEEISANSRLVISKQKRGKKDTLVLELFSVEKGCLTASGSATMRGNIDTEVAEAAKLELCIKKGRKIGNLIWSDRSANKMNWNSAKQYCEDLTEGGYTDWRLPNIDELRTLVQNHSGTRTGGTCPISEKAGKLAWSDRRSDCNGRNGSNFSKLGDADWFWSSSPLSDSTDYAWNVYFKNGNVYSFNKSYSYYVRCVRQRQFLRDRIF